MNSLYHKYRTPIIFAAIFIVTFIIYLFSGEGRPTNYNNFVRLADAFINGRLHLSENVPWLELAIYEGRHYIIPPPMPAILLMPYVLIKGLAANQVYASVFWGSINVSLAFLVAREMSKSLKFQILSAILFGFGTIHWWMASTGWVWFYSQVTSVTFMLLAILLTLRKYNNIFLIGLILGAAFWCRLPTILSAPFFLIMLANTWYKKDHTDSLLSRIRFKPIILFSCGLSIFILLNFAYNYMRFDSLMDKSYYLIPGLFDEPWYQKGLFHLSYIPSHLELLFLKLPVLLDEKPYIRPSWYGLSIFLTTPTIIYVLFNRPINKLVVGCLLTILLISLVIFSHGGTGWVQFGYRYAVDFYPFLFLLILRGSKDRLKWHYFCLFALGIIVNLWGVLWINKFKWIGW